MILGVLFGLRGSMLNAARLPCERIDELNAKASDISTDPNQPGWSTHPYSDFDGINGKSC